MSLLCLSLSIFKCDGKSVHSWDVRGFLRTKWEILNRPFIRIDRDLGDCLVQTPCCTNKTRKECTLFKITQLFLAKGGLQHRSLKPILYPLPYSIPSQEFSRWGSEPERLCFHFSPGCSNSGKTGVYVTQLADNSSIPAILPLMVLPGLEQAYGSY